MKKVSLGDVSQKSTLHSFPDEHIIISLSNKIFTFCKIYDFFKQKVVKPEGYISTKTKYCASFRLIYLSSAHILLIKLEPLNYSVNLLQ